MAKLAGRRLRAMTLILAGMPQIEVARELKVNPASVSRWHKAFREGGEEALRGPGAPAGHPALPRAVGEVEAKLLSGPKASGYAQELWTHWRGLRTSWSRWPECATISATSRGPARGWAGRARSRRERPGSAMRKRSQRWVKEEWPRIKGGRRTECRLDLHGRERVFLASRVRRTGQPRGQTPTLVHRFNWKRLNAIGAILCTPAGEWPQLFLHFQKEAVKEDDIVWFLWALGAGGASTGSRSRRWCSSLGRAAGHKSRGVKEHIAQQKDWLTVEPLPGYAPELNPVEYVWSPDQGQAHGELSVPDTIPELKDI